LFFIGKLKIHVNLAQSARYLKRDGLGRQVSGV